MADIVFTDFEGTYPPSGWTEQGTTANIGTSTVQAAHGTTSMRANSASAALAWIANSAQTARIRTGRFYLRIATAPAVKTALYQATNANGNLFVKLASTRIIEVTINTTIFTGPTLNLNQWYLIDFLMNTSGNPATISWKVDGVAPANQGSLAQVAANMTADNLGAITSTTYDLYFDDFWLTDQAADYPLGYIVPYVNQMPQLLAQ